jgi:glyoxylase-like metal-dependent hydrolase (beta-lactamase superfamily II)
LSEYTLSRAGAAERPSPEVRILSKIELIRYTLGPFEQNAYLLVGPSGREAAVVDPGFDSGAILRDVERRGLAITLILNTHGHLDHVAGNSEFKRRTGAALAIHPLDRPYLAQLPEQAANFGLRVEPSPEPDLDLEEGCDLHLDGVLLETIHTPGHTPGGVCLAFDDRLLVGDTLFAGSVGRTDLPGGSWEILRASIRDKLFRLPASTVCYPGHGPETTLAEERRSNPFVADVPARDSRGGPR